MTSQSVYSMMDVGSTRGADIPLNSWEAGVHPGLAPQSILEHTPLTHALTWGSSLQTTYCKGFFYRTWTNLKTWGNMRMPHRKSQNFRGPEPRTFWPWGDCGPKTGLIFFWWLYHFQIPHYHLHGENCLRDMWGNNQVSLCISQILRWSLFLSFRNETQSWTCLFLKRWCDFSAGFITDAT